MNLITENLIISPFKKKDVNDKYLSWMNDKSVIHYLGREDYFKGFTLKDGIDYLDEMKKNPEVSFLSIYHKDANFIGTCKVISISNSDKNKISEIGIMIGDKSYWGLGLAKETIWGLSNKLFLEKNQKIMAGGFASNLSMVNAFKSVGFKEEGIIRRRIYSKNKLHDSIVLGCFKDELKGY
jgi:RimJ/RimL family protein N-acetyltransferase